MALVTGCTQSRPAFGHKMNVGRAPVKTWGKQCQASVVLAGGGGGGGGGGWRWAGRVSKENCSGRTIGEWFNLAVWRKSLKQRR